MKNITINNEKFRELLEKCKMVTLYENSFAFEFTSETYSVKFYKDENGKNILEEFLKKVNNNWEDMALYSYQLKIMFDKLDNEELENQLNERPEHMQPEAILDHYNYFGVKRSDFY